MKQSDALVGRVVNLPHISNKKCIKIVLQGNLLKNTPGLSFCIGGSVGMSNIKILSVYIFVPGPQNSYQKCRQIHPTVKFH
jgi:hypothetical protein